ncbi:MAG TPA: GNAT family N-acetyltransferase [Chloroflexia bacterium]|nr:GNAT family N-acetyltransferase [Chloroflexia bacterium]
MEGNIEIREAAPADAPAIASVLYNSFLAHRAAYTAPAFAATTPGAHTVAARMDEGPAWVAMLNKVIVGTVAAAPRDEGLYVRSMAVLPEARGHRIGELLLEHVERYAREQGCKRMYLSTTPFLDRAIRLYERWGFRRDDTGPHDLHGTPLFTMVKTLDPAD